MATNSQDQDAQSTTTTSFCIPTPTTGAFRDSDSLRELRRISENAPPPSDTLPSMVTERQECDKTPKDDMFGTLKVVRDIDRLVEDDVYLIIDKSTKRALTCRYGNLSLENGTKATNTWKWRCSKIDGSVGFQNVAGGGFLGRDIWWNFFAKVYHQKGWESFKIERRPGAGHWIQTTHWWDCWQVCARADHKGLYAKKEGGTVWEFVKVLK